MNFGKMGCVLLGFGITVQVLAQGPVGTQTRVSELHSLTNRLNLRDKMTRRLSGHGHNNTAFQPVGNCQKVASLNFSGLSLASDRFSTLPTTSWPPGAYLPTRSGQGDPRAWDWMVQE